MRMRSRLFILIGLLLGFFLSLVLPNIVHFPLPVSLPVALPVSLQAQEWQNPAEKYSKAYDAYQNISCPIPNQAEDRALAHFAYFARDREALPDHAFLQNRRFAGAQIMYPWFFARAQEVRI